MSDEKVAHEVAEAPHRATRGGGPVDPQRIVAAICARGGR